jgi:hypothetical protein
MRAVERTTSPINAVCMTRNFCTGAKLRLFRDG